MQLRGDQLGAHLDKVGSGLRPVYVIHGDDPLLTQEAGDALRQAARAAGYTDRQVHTVSGAHFDWSAVQSAAGAMSLFADRQIIELRIPSGKPGKEGSVALQQLAESLADSDGTLLLVLLPRLDKATKTGAWFGALESYGVTIPVDPIERATLPPWIARRPSESESVRPVSCSNCTIVVPLSALV